MPGTRLLGFLSLVVFAVGSYGESAPAAHGRIVDQTRSAIVGARIALAGGADTLSDAQGAFVIAGGSGVLKLEITAGGFLPASRTITLPESGLDLGEIVLTIEPVRAGVTVNESADYQVAAVRSGAKTLTPLRDLPQSISVVTSELVKDQMMLSIGDVARYVPGVTSIQGENNRDQVVIRGNSSSADFFLNGVRDDVQYYRDLYNVENVEALKGPNAMAFGRGGGAE